MLVKNLNNTSGKSCPCGSWTRHWENFSGARYWPRKCGTKDCDNAPEVGAHVKKVGTNDPLHYIVMLCRSCNNRFGQQLKMEPYVRLARASIRETCAPFR